MRVNDANRQPILVPAEIPQPQPGEGEVLIRVLAGGVTPSELEWYPTTHTKDGTTRTRAVPGHEFSGVVAALGKGAGGFQVGDEIFGMNDWFADGATAEFCLTQPQNIAIKPRSITHEYAATVPIGALTAWQGLFHRAIVQPGERVLIHGAAGSVGIFVVQLAHKHGAYVIATASERNMEFVKQLGADEVIDYKKTRFDEEVRNIDVVFDAVGGDTLARSWSVLKAGGHMVTIAADSEATTDQRVKDAFFIVEPNQEQLVEIAEQVDAGRLKTFVNAIVPLEQASAAYSRVVENQRGFGKVVVTVAA